MLDGLVRDILDEFESLKNSQERQNKEAVWQEINEHIVPNRSGFEQDTPAKGERHVDKIEDGGPALALKTYQSGIMGQLLSQYLKFFTVYVPDEDLMDQRDIRIWTSKVDAVLYGLIIGSPFFSSMYEFFGDAGGVGTPTMHRYWDLRGKREVFKIIHPREIYIAENDHDEVDTHFRYYQVTAKKLIDAFGEDTVHPDVVETFNKPGGKYTEYKCIHAVYPNPDYDSIKKDQRTKKYLSCYVDVEHESKLRRGGFAVSPYATWRVEKEPDEVYGRGPGWRALFDVKRLYAFTKTDVTAAQLVSNPPLQYPEEMRGKLKWVPGGRMPYEDANRLVRQPEQRVELRAGLDREDRAQRIIEAHFFNPYFMRMQRLMDASGRQRTAYEVQRIEEETAILLGPHLTGLTPVMDRLLEGLFADAVEEGMIPLPPRMLVESGQRLNVRYMGPLALAQRRYFETEPYRRTLETIGATIATDPTGRINAKIWDNFDVDRMVREMSKSHGLPEENLIEERIRDKQRAEAAKQMAQQQRLAAMEQMGKAAPGLNQPVQKDSMLEDMGQMAQGQ